MKVVFQKSVLKSQMHALHRRGGNFANAARKISEILGRHSLEDNPENLFRGLNLTNHGESRIKHCVKYDLPGFCRLITIQDNGICAILFAGDHEECDEWLNRNQGYQLNINKNNELVGFRVTEDIKEVPENFNGGDSALAEGSLINMIDGKYQAILLKDLPALDYKKIEKIDSLTDDNEILDAIASFEAKENIRELVFDVLLCLKVADVDGAKNRILYYQEEILSLESAAKEVVENIKSNDNFIVLDDFDQRDLKTIIESANWQDWMLFMHPQQRHVVDQDFSGPARLLGVSGSGKTSVAVKRAIRLSLKYPGEKILITTINPALASLISELVNAALDGVADRQAIESNIIVKSFWDLCRDMILEFEKDPIKRKSFDQFSHKHLEDVDQIWEEFYLQQNNNNDALVMAPVHRSLIARGVNATQYLKQEMNWIRSAVSSDERESYLDIERKGRAENLSKDYRKLVLEGLNAWEKKLEDVGVCDYLGLLKPLDQYVDQITAKFRCIIVDELQDFGTTELRIIRRLANEADNDLFLCGDIAQQVQTKQHMPLKAGILVLPQNYLKINKNYRNSREILIAAQQVFQNNIDQSSYNDSDFELLNPEFANFSTPKPFIRKSRNLSDGLTNALNYLKITLGSGEKACIAIAGMSYFEVSRIGEQLDLPVLDGARTVFKDAIFLSDLDQTKGFEFDRMIIVNCNDGIIPNPNMPAEESFREVSKLYVAMTRAKKELIISYNAALSPWFSKALDYFNISTKWIDYLNDDVEPVALSFSFEIEQRRLANMSGLEFIYSPYAIGLDSTSIEKLETHVNGKKSTNFSGRADGWRNMSEFILDLKQERFRPHLTSLLGRNVYAELQQNLPPLLAD